MSAPSTSDTDLGFRGLPGLEWSADGSVHVDRRWVARLGAAVSGAMPGIVVQAVAAGSRWQAEQVLVDGRCVALRLRPRAGGLGRFWRRWFGESPSAEADRAARWHAPLFARTPWGSATAGIDPGLRGAAIVTLRTAGSPEPLPAAGPAFWRRRTMTEARRHVAEALRSAAPWTVTPEALLLPGGWRLPTVRQHGTTLKDGWALVLPPGFEWREGAGQGRARGELGGWRFTLGFVDCAGGTALCWLMARLDVADAGAWEPSLECALYFAHRRWAAANLPVECVWRAVNDRMARSGAELLVEWREAGANQPVRPA